MKRVKSHEDVNSSANNSKSRPKRNVKKRINIEETITISSSDSSSESNVEEYVPKTSKKTSTKKNINRDLDKTKHSKTKSNIQEKDIKNESENDVKSEVIPKRKRKLPDNTDETKNLKKMKINLKFKDEKPNTEEIDTLIKSETDAGNKFDVDWTEVQYIAEVHNVEQQIASNIVKLFEQENTVPFIARYRKNMTGGMEAEILRAIKESFEHAKTIKQRASTILKSIDKLGKWTPHIHSLVKSAKSLNTLEYINSMFKVPGKRSLSEKAKELGLGSISEKVLKGQPLPLLSSFIQSSKEGLRNENEIKDGIIHILADVITKDKLLFYKIQELRSTKIAYIQVSKRKVTAKEEKVIKEENKTRRVEMGEKYETYYDFKSRYDVIKPHQILAINRGENNKFLTVKITVANGVENCLRNEFRNIYKSSLNASCMHETLLMESFDYAYKKSIEPAFIRRVRSDLNEQAVSASIEVFAMNLKQLLLAPPFNGKSILGIDPGFSHGCKLAIISENGTVLATSVIYLRQAMRNKSVKSENATDILVELVKEYNCNVIALGNGTACRETEILLTNLIKSGAFKPLDVSYTIVNECGASIYSCSDEAKKEFPDMDYNLISAISIARRLQNPLAELVKIEPKHLGVGMYQHDLPKKQLEDTLSEVVIEAVSFVGVDVNTASLCLLKRIAGLTQNRAKAIIDWRNRNGSFKNRKQLLDVKGIGNKTFEQCAGFIRILPETVLTSKKSSTVSLNYLDQTWIHPESYSIANKIVKEAGCNIKNLGTDAFINAINKYAQLGNSALAEKFKTEESTIDIIINGLTMKKDYDVRLKHDKPLFRKSLKGIEDLEMGITLRGEVRNVTHFGAFVDIGVSRDGLIPLKFMKGQTLKIAQRVQVKIISVEKERNRICLELVEVCQ